MKIAQIFGVDSMVIKNRLSFFAGLVIVMFCSIVRADTPTLAELNAIKALPAGYFVFAASFSMHEGIYKTVLGDTSVVMLTDSAGWPSINPENGDIIAYAKVVKAGTVSDNGNGTWDRQGAWEYEIWLMNSDGNQKRKISSSNVLNVNCLNWCTGSKLVVQGSSFMFSNYVNRGVYVVDTSGTVSTLNLGNITWGNDQSGIDHLQASSDRIFMRLMGTSPNSQNCMFSWNSSQPQTAPVYLGNKDGCGPAISFDGTVASSNYSDHTGVFLHNARTMTQSGEFAFNGKTVTPLVGSNFHNFAYSNDKNWAINQTRFLASGKVSGYIYVLDMVNQRLTRQSWTDYSQGAWYPSLFIGDVNPNKIKAPVFAPPARNFFDSVSVSLSCATSGAQIYYTIDGTDPAQSSTLFSTSAPIKIKTTTTVKARAYKTGMDVSNIASAKYTFTVPTASLDLKINCGGNASGPYIADTCRLGGTVATPITNVINLTGITNPAPTVAYQTSVYGQNGNFSYLFETLKPGDKYDVRLHFAEPWWTQANKRKFNVVINGTGVLTAFDIFTEAGAAYKAVVKDFTTTVDSLGQVKIDFNNGTLDFATINAIEITRNTTVQSAITILSPNGGQYGVGSSMTIKWINPVRDEVVIRFSLNDGIDFTMLADKIQPNTTSDTGSYTWTIPATTSFTNTAIIEMYRYGRPDLPHALSNVFSIQATTSVNHVVKATARYATQMVAVYRIDGSLVGRFSTGDMKEWIARTLPVGTYIVRNLSVPGHINKIMVVK